MDAVSLRTDISAALAADIGIYTLLNGATTPAISVRPEGQRLEAGTVASGLEVVIISEPRLSPVGAYLEQDTIREFIVFLVGWDETADITTAAEKLVYIFPGSEWQEIPIAKRIGPANQARVIIRSGATAGAALSYAPNESILNPATLRAEIASALYADLGTYTLLNGDTTPAISVRPEGVRLAAGTTATGLEVVILAEPRLSPVGAYLQQETRSEYFVFLVGWDDTADTTEAAEKLVHIFPGTIWQEIPIAKRIGPTNQARVIIQSNATAGLIVAPGPRQGSSVRTLVITGSATGSSGGQDLVTGASSSSFTLTGSAAGVVAVVGSASLTLAIAGIASGIVGIRGASTATLSIIGSASGVIGVVTTGASSATFAISGLSAGTVSVSGSSSQTIVINGSASGAIAVVGASSMALPIAGVASGAVAVVGGSSATLVITGTSAGVIGAVATGASSATLAIVGTAAGSVAVAGASSQTLAISGSAAATNRVGGASAITLGLTGIATSAVRVGGASSLTLSIAGAASGAVAIVGASSATLAITGTAAGSVDAGAGVATFGGLSDEFYAGGTSLSTMTVTLPNVATGDLVLIVVCRFRQRFATGVTVGGNAATLIKRNDTGQDFEQDVWGLISPSNISSATITANYSTSAEYGVLIAARWSGVSSATPLASSCNTTGCSALASSSTNRLAQSITTSQRALIVAVGVDWTDLRSHTPASGWTERFDGSGTPIASYQFLHDRVSDAGTFGGATAFSTAGSDEYIAMMMAFPLL